MSVDALSLACNIMTVIDFGHKFYQSFRDIYENRKPDSSAEARANDLLLLTERLKDSRKKAQRSAPKNDQLFQIADKCAKVATNLHREITKFDLPGASSRAPHGVQSLVSTAKRTWRQNRIEQLKKSLDDCQTTMQTAVLFKMYESGEADQVRRLENFDRLESRLQNFVQAVSKQELRMSELLAENRSLHQETQAVVRHEVAVLRNLQISEAELTRLKASLKFPGQNQRYNDLRPAHSKSFTWLLGDSSEEKNDSDVQSLDTDYSGTSGSGSQDSEQAVGSEKGGNEEPEYLRQLREETYGDFARWLEFEPDSKLYWISGKPGAGKSTLMKYLLEQIEKAHMIKGSHLAIHHFFWLGTANRRSNYNDMQGMFMTILPQLLEHELPEVSLAATLLQRMPRIRQKEASTEWSLTELKEATQEALNLLTDHYTVYFLLDALDEHLPATDHDELLQVIKHFEKMPQVRLIVSSRREKIFERHLSSARQLRLQNLTAPDIHYFALDALSNVIQSEDSISTDFLDDIVPKIVTKADGVFLWARLAVDSIKRGLIDGNELDELRDRLNDMPMELSDYFRYIWKRLGDDQQRYQTRAANIFSLLCCSSWSNRLFTPPGPSSRFNHMNAYDKDLLCLSLALNPICAHLIVQGSENVMEALLLDQCESLEKIILSSCAGLVELQESSAETQIVDYCIPCNVEPMIISRRYDFVHRTARDFLLETEEGKVILAANDLGSHGPNFRVFQAVLARSVLFRAPRQVLHRCLPKRSLDIGSFLLNLKTDQELKSSLDQMQRYALLDLSRRVYYRFSGHSENPRFQDWKLRRSCAIHPFIAIVAYFGHSDYAFQWMQTGVSRGRIFPAEMYNLVFKAHEHDNLSSADVHKPSPYIDPCFESFDKFNSFIPRACLHPKLRKFYTVGSDRQLQNLLQQFISSWLYLSRELSNVPAHAEVSSSKIKWLIALVNSPGFDPFATVPFMYIIAETSATTRHETPGHVRPILLSCPPLMTIKRRQSSSTPGQVHMLYETNPLWVCQYVARMFASSPEAESLCNDLMRFVHLHGDDGRKVQNPQPFLLFIGPASGPLTSGTAWIQEAKKVPITPKFQWDDIEQNNPQGWPLQELWEELGTDVLDETQIEEILVTHKVRISRTELRQLMTSCDIRIADEDAPEPEDGDQRFIFPPEGCSTEQETLSHLTMGFQFLYWGPRRLNNQAFFQLDASLD